MCEINPCSECGKDHNGPGELCLECIIKLLGDAYDGPKAEPEREE